MSRRLKKQKAHVPSNAKERNAYTMKIMRIVAARAREFRDQVCDELEREGIIIEKRGDVEAVAVPATAGYGSVEWKNWTFSLPEALE